MEAGADFDLRDGVTLRAGGDSVNIAPDPERECLRIQGTEGLAESCAGLLRALEEGVVSDG